MTSNGPERLSSDQKTRIRYLIRFLSFGGRNSKKQVRLFVSFALQAFVLFKIESNIENSVNQLNFKASELKKLKQLALILNTKPLNLEKARTCFQSLNTSTCQILTSFVQSGLTANSVRDFDYYVEHELSRSIAALDRTRKFFRDPTGRRHSTAKLNLVRSLVNIYKAASENDFGLGLSSTPLGPNYLTPGEHLLFNALKLVDGRISIDAMRELYRSACRSGLSTFRKKPIRKTPANK
jgi:hypothetical protein